MDAPSVFQEPVADLQCDGVMARCCACGISVARLNANQVAAGQEFLGIDVGYLSFAPRCEKAQRGA